MEQDKWIVKEGAKSEEMRRISVTVPVDNQLLHVEVCHTRSWHTRRRAAHRCMRCPTTRGAYKGHHRSTLVVRDLQVW